MSERAEDEPADALGEIGGKHWVMYMDEVDRLLEGGEISEAEELLWRIVDASEHEAVTYGLGTNPNLYARLWKIYSERGDEEAERNLLRRFAAQEALPGRPVTTHMLHRLSILDGKPDTWGGRLYSQDPRTEPWAPMFGKPTRPAVVSAHIARWWSDEHDNMIRAEVERTAWYWDVSTQVLESLTQTQLDTWRSEDPALDNLSETQLIRDYADHRVKSAPIGVPVPSPELKPCANCGELFIEASVEPRWIARFGYRDLRHCRVCLTFVQDGRRDSTREAVVQFIKDAVAFFRVIPTSREWLVGPHLHGDDLIKAYGIMARRPSPEFVREEFGSWFAALAAAGVVNGDGEASGRGIRSIASDGHLCLSLGERTICEALADAGIAHDREPRYPDSNMRADFKIGDLLVEYLGMTGDPVYDEKTVRKRAHAEKHGLEVLFLYPKDLADHERLVGRLTAHLLAAHKSH